MKKAFKFLSLFMAITITVSAFAFTAFAETTQEFTEIVNMTFDDLGINADETYRSSGTLYYPAWPDSFVSIAGYNSSVVLKDDGTGNLVAQGINNSNDSNVTYIVLPEIAKTKSADVVSLRKQDTILSFDFKMSANMYLKLWANGTHPEYVENFTEGSNVIATTLMEIKEGNNNIVNYNYTPGNAGKYTASSKTDLFKRDTFHNVKIVVKAPKYENGSLTSGGTYDVYFDGVLINENLNLSGPGYLYKIYMQFFAKNNVSTGTSYVDNIAYYALGNGDADAQTTYKSNGNGKIIPEKNVTKTGDVQKFNIIPDEGYEIRRVLYNGKVILGYNNEGFTYETPALTAEGGALEVTFDKVKTFNKVFDNNFNDYEAGRVLVDTLNDNVNDNQASANLVKSSNVFGNDSVVSIHKESEGNNSLKAIMPASGTTNESVLAVYAMLNQNDYANAVYDDHAVTFKLKASNNQYFRYVIKNYTTNTSSTIMETSNGKLNFYEFYYDSNGARKTRTIKSEFSPYDGNYHTYKMIIEPKKSTYDVYIDDKLIVDNVEFKDSDWLYYALIQVKGSKTEDMVAYVDDFACYELSRSDVTAQLNITSSNGKVTADKIITPVGDKVNLTIAPDYGYEIDNVTYNGEAVNVSDVKGFTFESPAITANGGALSVTYKEVRHFKNIFDINYENYTENQVIADSLNDDKVGNQTNIDFIKVNNQNCANAWVLDTLVTAEKEADGNISGKFYLPKGSSSTKSNVTMYTLLENADKSIYKETTTDYFVLSFRLKTEVGQEGRFLVRSATKDTGGKSIVEWKNNKTTFYSYYYDESNTIKYKGASTNLNVNDGEYHFYKFVFNPKNQTFDAYVDNILCVENVGFVDGNQIYYATLQLYGSTEKDLTFYMDDYSCYEMTEADACAQISAKVTGNGKIVTDKMITKAGDVVSLMVVPAENNVIKNIAYNGKNVPAFDSKEDYILTSVAGDKLNVEFYELSENSPTVLTTDYAVKEGKKIYLINKLIENNCDVTEYGMLFSKTNSKLAIGGADTSVIRYSPNKVNGAPFGYHGFLLYNNTAEEDITFYVRPYAKVGDSIYYGDIKSVDTSVLETIAGE